MLDNIPEDTPEGTLVGTLEDISVINSKSMLRSIGTLYQYSKQYCNFNGVYIIGLNNDGQSQAEIILPSKYYDETSKTIRTIMNIDFANNFLGSASFNVATPFTILVFGSSHAGQLLKSPPIVISVLSVVRPTI